MPRMRDSLSFYESIELSNGKKLDKATRQDNELQYNIET
jgi:hypothetical protein